MLCSCLSILLKARSSSYERHVCCSSRDPWRTQTFLFGFDWFFPPAFAFANLPFVGFPVECLFDELLEDENSDESSDDCDDEPCSDDESCSDDDSSDSE